MEATTATPAVVGMMMKPMSRPMESRKQMTMALEALLIFVASQPTTGPASRPIP